MNPFGRHGPSRGRREARGSPHRRQNVAGPKARRAFGAGFSLLLGGCAALPTRFPPSRIRLDPLSPPPHDLRLAFHVHTGFSSDSRGTVGELVALARDLGYDGVVVADHDRLDARPEEGVHGDPPVVVVVAQEIGTADGHLVAVGASERVPEGLSGPDAIARVRASGGMAIVSHPRYPFLGWTGGDDVDAIEIYNLATDLADDFPLWTLARFGLIAPLDGSLALRGALGEPARDLRDWDRTLASRRVIGVGACDSHANLGIPHRDRLRVVTTHVLSRDRTPEAVVDALRAGLAYTAFERLAPVRAFVFEIEGPGGAAASGGALPARFPLRAVVRLDADPDGVDVRLLRDGRVVDSGRGAVQGFPVPGPGVYRVEVRRRGALWVLSNPIRVGGAPGTTEAR